MDAHNHVDDAARMHCISWLHECCPPLPEPGGHRGPRVEVGVVQKEITVGLGQSDVAVILGAPNIVTRDSQNRETWVYDKIATEASFSQDSGSVFGMITGNGRFSTGRRDSGDVNANAGGNYARQAGAASLTQRTLTVVIKFDRNSAVESLSYHATTF